MLSVPDAAVVEQTDAQSDADAGSAEPEPSPEAAVPEMPAPTSNVSVNANCRDSNGTALPDVTGHLGSRQLGGACAHYRLEFEICNGGALALAPGVASAVYVRSPRNELVCTTRTTESIEPGKCAVMRCQPQPALVPNDLVVLELNDEGTGKRSVAECTPFNNTDVQHAVICDPK